LALADSGLGLDGIDEVVLVGGATRTPLVRRRVQELFGRVPHSELNPDEVVALGAAVQADILAGGTTHMLLLDVTPLSLGIETLGGAVSVLIPRNTTIPTSANEGFTTSVDGQAVVDMHVVQGERDLAKDNRSLARFDLRGIPPMPGSPASRSPS
jgi:molecular chaperone DnaK (HSP70)